MDYITKSQLVVLGAICGDIIGSEYEWNSTKDYNFGMFLPDAIFTDDTVCTIAIADALTSDKSCAESLKSWCRKYPYAGYGGAFRRWIASESAAPYNSWGKWLGHAGKCSRSLGQFRSRSAGVGEKECRSHP